jgi:hypothetical protein
MQTTRAPHARAAGLFILNFFKEKTRRARSARQNFLLI